jgi:hypothetical protein
MLREVAVYIQPHQRPKYSSLLLVNLLLQENVTKEAVNSLLVDILQPNEELGVGILACYKRKDYGIAFYVFNRLFPEIEYDEGPPSAVSTLRFLRTICEGLFVHSNSNLYGRFFATFLECAFSSSHFEFIF